MPKKPKSIPRWLVVRIKGTPAASIGTVEAPDAKAAIRAAIEKYGITIRSSRAGLRRIGFA